MSNKRQRTEIIPVRVTRDEKIKLRTVADRRGLSASAIVREVLFGIPAGPGVRRPTVDVKLMVQALAQIGKIGSNINQIAYHLNAGRPGDRIEGALDEALRELLEWRTVLMQALGAERHRKPDDN
jgi:hypothetical protein